ncbi:MAG: NAD-dependent epimerase/dehydratase family protein, partial [Pseudomonadota bacterium]
MVSLVTGGAGFVGKHLVAALRARGERVRVLDLKPDTVDEASGGGVEAIAGSVTNAEAARAACDGAESVFHLAGNAQLWAPDPSVFDAVNRGGTETMLAAAKDAGVKRFVHCSSLTTLVSRRAPIGPSSADETI